MKQQLKVAVVGPRGAGKDTVARYLASHFGFVHISSGDLIRDYIVKNVGVPPTRELMQNTANMLRVERGADYLVRLALETPAEKLAVSGLRAIAEAETFKKEGGVIIAVTAPLEIRYKWGKQRGDIDSTVTFEQFKVFEEAEYDKIKADNVQNVAGVIARADYVISNEGTLEDLYKKVEDVVGKISS